MMNRGHGFSSPMSMCTCLPLTIYISRKQENNEVNSRTFLPSNKQIFVRKVLHYMVKQLIY